jgi:large subunit ribosomal protein L24
MNMNIRKNDMVVVIAGNDADAAKVRKVTRVLPSEGKVVVEGVNRTFKHIRPSKRNMQGGRLSIEQPIDASNVLLYCGACKSGVRTGREHLPDGTKVLFCKKCKKAGRAGIIRVLAKAAAPKATK